MKKENNLVHAFSVQFGTITLNHNKVKTNLRVIMGGVSFSFNRRQALLSYVIFKKCAQFRKSIRYTRNQLVHTPEVIMFIVRQQVLKFSLISKKIGFLKKFNIQAKQSIWEYNFYLENF